MSRIDVPLLNDVSYRRRRQLRQYGMNLLTLIGILVILFPLFWVFSTAIRENVYVKPTPLLPRELTLRHFTNLTDTVFMWNYLNSIFYTLGVVLITVVASTLGGYGLARLNISFRKTFVRTILFGYMFPPILLSLPMFLFWREIGILNSYLGLMIAMTALPLPFSLWLMWKFFQTVPESMEESARMAGATRFRAFYEIAVPMAKPGIVAVGVYSFAAAWSQYTIPSIIMQNPQKWPITVGLEQFTIQQDVFWGQVMAAIALTIIPAFLFVHFLQTYMLRGFRLVE